VGNAVLGAAVDRTRRLAVVDGEALDRQALRAADRRRRAARRTDPVSRSVADRLDRRYRALDLAEGDVEAAPLEGTEILGEEEAGVGRQRLPVEQHLDLGERLGDRRRQEREAEQEGQHAATGGTNTTHFRTHGEGQGQS